MIRITNVSTSMVSLYVPEIKLNRDLTPGRTISVTPEEYEELTFDTGFNSLLRGHYIRVDGLEEDKQVEIISNIVDAKSIENMLLKGDVAAFAKFIPRATEAEKESAVTLAVEHKITNAGINALIKKYCGIDVINAIAVKHDAEEK
jgi:hypothetical protein